MAASLLIDAMGCQKLRRKFVKEDYILMVKDNRPELKEQIQKVFKLGKGIKTAADITA